VQLLPELCLMQFGVNSIILLFLFLFIKLTQVFLFVSRFTKFDYLALFWKTTVYVVFVEWHFVQIWIIYFLRNVHQPCLIISFLWKCFSIQIHKIKFFLCYMWSALMGQLKRPKQASLSFHKL
jgi:hypothetical protein